MTDHRSSSPADEPEDDAGTEADLGEDSPEETEAVEPLAARKAPRAPWDKRLRFAVTETAGFFLYAVKRYGRDETVRVAASLSYTTLLAMVPMLVIALAIFAAFPAFQQVRDQVLEFAFQNFVPHAGDVVKTALNSFISAAGSLTAVGIVMLGATAVMLLMTIEKALNGVFRVERQRSLTSRLLLYWTLLTLGPMLLGASFSLSGYFFALAKLAEQVGGGVGVGWATRSIPLLLALFAFTLLYIAVPNRVVRIRDGLVGGLTAALAFGALRYGFTWYVTNNTTYQTIYGALASVPLFLVWLYLSWAVVLFGAVVAAALPEWRTRRGRALMESSGEARLTLALDLLAELHRSGNQGRAAHTADLLSHSGAPEGALSAVLARLAAAGFVAHTDKGRWVQMRDLEDVTLNDLVEALELGYGSDLEPEDGEPRWHTLLRERLHKAKTAEREIFDVPVRTVLLGSSE